MIFGYRNAHLFPHRVFIPAINEKLDPEGRLTAPDIDQRLSDQARDFAAFAAHFPGK